MKKILIIFMLLISPLTYSKGLYSSSIDTTQKIEIKPKSMKNFIGLEIIGTPLKLSYSRLIHNKNNNAALLKIGINPMFPLDLVAFGIPNLSFSFVYRFPLSTNSFLFSEIGTEILPFYFPVIYSKTREIIQWQTFTGFVNIGYTLCKKNFDFDFLSIKVIKQFGSGKYSRPESDTVFKSSTYTIIPTTSIYLKF